MAGSIQEMQDTTSYNLYRIHIQHQSIPSGPQGSSPAKRDSYAALTGFRCRDTDQIARLHCQLTTYRTSHLPSRSPQTTLIASSFRSLSAIHSLHSHLP